MIKEKRKLVFLWRLFKLIAIPLLLLFLMCFFESGSEIQIMLGIVAYFYLVIAIILILINQLLIKPLILIVKFFFRFKGVKIFFEGGKFVFQVFVEEG